jgi:hypothetical protein
MTVKKKQPVNPVTKPYLTGAVTDENTLKKVLKFFGSMLLMIIMCFIICTMMNFGNGFLRVSANAAVVLLVLFILYNQGQTHGAEAVARGEILYQRQEKGLDIAAGERRLSYHPLKGYVTALIGMIPFVILAVILAIGAERQMTTAGTLPGWTSSLMRRSDIGGALVSYTEGDPLRSMDIIRMIVRVAIMPFVSMVGSANKDLMLTVERISPILLLLPVISYGTGFLFGKNVRTRIHTQIEENRKIRKKREIKARKARRRTVSAPEQLN